jgi:nicotinate phosphoribosyltransferase
MKRKPIIQSLLDLDFYKLTMAQVAWKLHRNVEVEYGGVNRTQSIRIADIVDIRDYKRELNHVRSLRFRAHEISYLRSLGVFEEDFLAFLPTVHLPKFDVTVQDGQFVWATSGAWPVSMFWETFKLSIENELYNRAYIELHGLDLTTLWMEADAKLSAKIEALLLYHEAKVCDYGTRRRQSREWHEYVVRRMSNELGSQFIGTSNVYLAMKHGIPVKGTMAHEMFMVYAGIFGDTDEGLLASHNKVLEDWRSVYGDTLSVALTDTFGTDFFFRSLTYQQALEWKALRQDSGNPFEFADKALAFYRGHGIDPLSKTIVFSDSLDVEAIIALFRYTKGKINVMFGWGTNLTNDFGIPHLNIVVKAIRANGRPLVKLSDNKGKHMGPLDEQQRCIRVFEYQEREAIPLAG